MTKVITFDKKITHFGGCTVDLNNKEKCLNIKMVNEDETTLSINFNYKFIKKQNFLCAFQDDNDSNWIMIIFEKIKECKTIYYAITKAKKKDKQLLNDFDEDETFKSSFFIPLIEEIHGNTSIYQDLKEVVLNFVNSLGNNEKVYYLNLLVNAILTPGNPSSSGYGTAGDGTATSLNKIEPEKGEASPILALVSSLNEVLYVLYGDPGTQDFDYDDYSLDAAKVETQEIEESLNDTSSSTATHSYGLRNRKRRSYAKLEFSRSNSPEGDQTVKIKLPRKDEPTKPRTEYINIQAQDYHIHKFLNGKLQLQVFAPDDRTKCYRYYSSKKSFRCLKCQKQKYGNGAMIKKNPDGTEYVKMKAHHVCQPSQYYPSETVQLTSFEDYENEYGKELFIFINDGYYFRYYYLKQQDYYACAHCGKLGKMTEAVIRETENGERYVEAETVHICAPRQYIPKIRAPWYLIRPNRNGNNQLVVFANVERTLCHTFYWHKTEKVFNCFKCFAKHSSLAAKIYNDVNGEEFVQFYHQHDCAPIPYVP
uniref:Uncharacterized protein n=1 Tax=Panagrolaimus sp. PS1159 TaxID=55785 RepID=A0AC35G2V6_9BILA